MAWLGNVLNKFAGVGANENMEVPLDYVREEEVATTGRSFVEETEVEKLKRENEELKRRLFNESNLALRMERLEKRFSRRFGKRKSTDEKIRRLEEGLGREREEKQRLIEQSLNCSLLSNNEEITSPVSPAMDSQTEEDQEVTSQSEEEERTNSMSEKDVESQEDDAMSVDDSNSDEEEQNDLKVNPGPSTTTRSSSGHSSASSVPPLLIPLSSFQSFKSASSPESTATSSPQSRERKMDSVKSPNTSVSPSAPTVFKRTLPLPPLSCTERNKRRLPPHRHAMDRSKLRFGWYCICSGVFTTQGQLSEHIKYFIREPKFPCPMCPKRWPGLKYLRDHLRTSHKTADPYPGCFGCADCGKISKNREEHKAHRLANHPRWTERLKKLPHGIDHTVLTVQGVYRCLCTREFGNMNSLKSHVLNFTAPARFCCDQCPSKFTFYGHLRNHKENIHQKKPDPSVRLGCNQCGQLFHSRKELQQHLHRQHGIISWNQPQTQSMEMADPATRPKKHGFDPGSSTWGSVFRCFCGSGYSTKKELQAHIYRARPRVPFKCPHCPVDFREHTRLAQHIRRVHKVTDYEAFGCTTCGTSWPNRIALRRHQESEGHRGF